MNTKFKSIIVALFITLYFSVLSFAGTANLTIVHENQNLNVVKYIIKYGAVQQDNPDDYPNTVEISPAGGPVKKQSVIRVDLGVGNSGYYYFTVKDIYEDSTESSFSESSFPILIPKKTINVGIN